MTFRNLKQISTALMVGLLFIACSSQPTPQNESNDPPLSQEAFQLANQYANLKPRALRQQQFGCGIDKRANL